MNIILTCEHASAEIPPEFKMLFLPHADLLKTHLAIDIGAILLWETFRNYPSSAISLAVKGKYSRLLVDLNRSEKNEQQLFSNITKSLNNQTKQEILTRYYYPYRQPVIDHIKKLPGPIFHLSIHTFTPILNGEIRQTDIGLLYDPDRPFEKQLSEIWAKKIRTQDIQYRVRMNYPYYGKNDGFTSYFRKFYPVEKYIGLELEVNQQFFLKDLKPESLIHVLAETFFAAVGEM